MKHILNMQMTKPFPMHFSLNFGKIKFASAQALFSKQNKTEINCHKIGSSLMHFWNKMTIIAVRSGQAAHNTIGKKNQKTRLPLTSTQSSSTFPLPLWYASCA